MTTSRVNCWRFVPLLLVTLAGCESADQALDRAAAVMTEARYRESVAALAADEFEGRSPGTPGGERTVEYLERRFRELGLQPANGDSFRQEVALVELTAGPETQLSFARDQQRLALAYGDEMVLTTRRVQPEAAIADSEVVFVGYGIVAPEYGWNDYAGVDMRGKTALILVNDPGFGSGDPELFHGRAMTYYGRWTYKFEEAARQGAAAALIIHDTAPAAYGWDVVRNGWTGPKLYAETADGNAGRCALEGWITHDRAAALAGLAGQDLAALERAAMQRGFRALPLGVTASGGLHNAIRRTSSPNVAGLLPGRKRPDEYLIYMAHWDHLGRGQAASDDSIFNGAVDNATGVAAVLTIAQAWRALRPAPERSILFLAVTAEESGLLGSEHYANAPLVPLEKTAAVINIDALGPLGRAEDIEVIGFGASGLEELLAAAAGRQGRVVTPDQRPEAGFFYRSDHFHFAKQGVPALYVKSGMRLRDRPPGTGAALIDDYVVNRYHKPADEYDPGWDVSGSLEDLRLLFEVGVRVASDRGWPDWYAGNEFRAARLASAAARGAGH
ncbi:MAG: M20/M25/M40 family metallo-hydrolase [Gammaproteobacteria bacterium]|nr:M20/M25/M40 family metallo-hydrolase [Gammaproteobacteria bacterium]